MAQRVQILLIDDVDGAAADETITFGLDGRTYEIDLSTTNDEQLRQAVTHWAGHARPATKTTKSTPPRQRRTRVGPSNTTLREWAKATGHPVADRGQISNDLRQAYREAHPDEAD